MFGRYSIGWNGGIFIGVMLGIICVVIPSMYIGSIDIVFDKGEELQQCQYNLDQTIKSKIPECPKVVCKESNSTFFMSAIWFVAGLIMYIIGFRKLDQSKNKEKSKPKKVYKPTKK